MTETTATIDPKEAAHFGEMAADWWNPAGSSAMLHKLNPVRLAYIRAAIDRHWPGREQQFRPLEGRRALVTCSPLATTTSYSAGS